MHYKKTMYLTEDAKNIREAVFVKEQGFKDEFDNIDDSATHIVIYDNNTPVGVSRYFPNKEDDTYTVGRIAVCKKYRKHHLGEYILKITEENILKDGGCKIILAAQTHAQKFYEKYGYTAAGSIFLEEHCPHINMQKLLK